MDGNGKGRRQLLLSVTIRNQSMLAPQILTSIFGGAMGEKCFREWYERGKCSNNEKKVKNSEKRGTVTVKMLCGVGIQGGTGMSLFVSGGRKEFAVR